MNVLEYRGKLPAVDCGVLFPEESQPASTSSSRFLLIEGPYTIGMVPTTATRTTSVPCLICLNCAAISRSRLRPAPWPRCPLPREHRLPDPGFHRRRRGRPPSASALRPEGSVTTRFPTRFAVFSTGAATS